MISPVSKVAIQPSYIEVPSRALLASHSLIQNEIPSGLFFSQWKSAYLETPGNIRISYVSGSQSALYQAKEEALHLSQVLGGVLVAGIHHRKQSLFVLRSLARSTEVRALVEFWDRFLLKNPHGIVVQYFYGDGGEVIQEALNQSSCGHRVIIVGINPTITPAHASAYYFGSTNGWLCGGRHRYDLMLPRNPNSEGMVVRRLIDPVFVAALQHPFLCVSPSLMGKSSSSEMLALTPEILAILDKYSDKASRYHVELASIVHMDRSEIFFRGLRQGSRLARAWKASLAERELWPERRIDRAVGLTLSALKVYSYAVCLSAHRMQEHVAEPKKVYCRHETSTARAFVRRKHFSGYVLSEAMSFGDNKVYPAEIFPGAIFPNGQFTRIRAPKFRPYPDEKGGMLYHITDLFPYGIFKEHDFPHSRFFFGGLLSCPGRRTVERRDPIRPHLHSSVLPNHIFPDDIQCDGLFINRPHDPYPYGEFPSGLYDDSGMSALRDIFPYASFFRGELIPERFPNGTAPLDHPIRRTLPDGVLPKVYPGGILPNGTFLHGAISHPFGVFPNHSFPYKEYFFGNFDYKGRFLAQLANSRDPRFIATTEKITALVTTTVSKTSHTAFVEKSIATGQIDLAGAYVFIGFWSVYSIAQAILLYLEGSQRVRQVRAIALGISSAALYVNSVELVHKIRLAYNGKASPFDTAIHGSLIAYGGTALLRDAIKFANPWIKQQCHRVARTLALVRTPSEEMHKISNRFRSELRNTRITSAIVHLLIAGIMSGFFTITSGSAEWDFEAGKLWMIQMLFVLIVSVSLVSLIH